MDIVGIILGFLLTVLMVLAALFVIRRIEFTRNLAGLKSPEEPETGFAAAA